jgi:hypothetical protein
MQTFQLWKLKKNVFSGCMKAHTPYEFADHPDLVVAQNVSWDLPPLFWVTPTDCGTSW